MATRWHVIRRPYSLSKQSSLTGYGDHSAWPWPEQIGSGASQSPAFTHPPFIESFKHFQSNKHRYNDAHICLYSKTCTEADTHNWQAGVEVWNIGEKTSSLSKSSSLLFFKRSEDLSPSSTPKETMKSDVWFNSVDSKSIVQLSNQSVFMFWAQRWSSSGSVQIDFTFSGLLDKWEMSYTYMFFTLTDMTTFAESCLK